MPRVLANGVSLYYEEHGAGDAIVCIHGSGSSAALWSGAVEELAARGRAILYDRRGCSRSERPEPYATEVHEQADDAAALIDALAAVPAIVIGRSYGVDIAIDLCLRFPDRVRALALLEGGESISEAGARWLADLAQEVFAAAERDPSRVGETLLRSVLGDEPWRELPEPVKEIFTENGPAIAAEFRGGYPTIVPERLATIVQPTLLVTGEDSPPVYVEVTELLAEALPSARVERVEGGHVVNPAHPAVLGFLDEVTAGRI